MNTNALILLTVCCYCVVFEYRVNSQDTHGTFDDEVDYCDNEILRQLTQLHNELSQLRKQQQVERENINALTEELKQVRQECNTNSQQQQQQQADDMTTHNVTMTTASQMTSAKRDQMTTMGVISVSARRTMNVTRGRLATHRSKLIIAQDPSSLVFYDINTLDIEKRVNITGTICLTDVATCEHCDFIYASDECDNKVHVIDDNGRIQSEWSTTDSPGSMSINAQTHAIVVFPRSRTIREYTSTGQMIRAITVPAHFSRIWHAIQMTPDSYIVSNGFGSADSFHQVCIIDNRGVAVQCYRGGSGTDIAPFNSPIRLAVHGDKLIVADYYNHRLLLFNIRPLYFIQELQSQIKYPASMVLNQSGSRLFVASDTSLIVLDITNI